MSARSRVSARSLALLLVVLFLLPSGPVAADAPPLSLADDGTISVTWKDIIAGKPVAQILNLTMAPLSVDVVLDEAGLANAADAAKPRLGGPNLVTAYTGRTVPAGEHVARGAGNRRPAHDPRRWRLSGLADGALCRAAVRAPSRHHDHCASAGRRCRPTAGGDPVPLMDSWTVWLVRYGGPFGGPGVPSPLRADDVYLPLNVAKDVGAVNLAPDTSLGALSSEQDGLATVSYSGSARVLDNGEFGIELVLHGPRSRGEVQRQAGHHAR